jgi:hypothetical protein
MSTLGGLSEALARIAELEAALGAAEQAREQWHEAAWVAEGMVREAIAAQAVAEARLARLAPLETAARAWCNTPSTGNLRGIYDAVAALDAPAGEAG